MRCCLCACLPRSTPVAVHHSPVCRWKVQRMAFWKPGTAAPGLGVGAGILDRETEQESSFVIGNTYKQLSIYQQRVQLPIFALREQLLYLIQNFQLVVLIGETGSGKTTQLPQYLCETGWAPAGRCIAVTQPRRVAATSVAKRVAEEMGVTLGAEVGYCIRFEDCSGPETRIKFLTDGVLLREMMLDPLLQRYTVVVVDEAHERSVHTDIILALLKKVMKRRPDLRVVISSATVDAEAFKAYFTRGAVPADAATIVSVEGRMYPVDVFYLAKPCSDFMQAACDTVLRIHRGEESGDVLVFMPGQEEIERTISLIEEGARGAGAAGLALQVLPMYAGLPVEDQMKVFEPAKRGHRKVIVATNIAETSVTIPNIAFIVDAGFVKQRWYDSATGIDVLLTVPTSQASAHQRAGRAGRVRNGKAFRLYTEADFERLRPHDAPEMQRTNMAPVVLQLKAFGIEDVLHFDYMSPPPIRALERSLELLLALGAVDDECRLTHPLGTRMAELPVDPMIAKLLLSAVFRKCAEEALIIAAMLSVQAVFQEPSQAKAAAEQQHRKFWVTEGDHLSLLNVFVNFQAAKKGNAAEFCRKHFLNYRALVRATDIRAQLRRYLERFKLPIESSDDPVEIRKAIVGGFFAHAARLLPDGSYETIKDKQVLHIYPGSVVYKYKQPEWVVFHDVVHTSKKYMRDITVIEPAWLTDIAPHFYEWRKHTVAVEPGRTAGETLRPPPGRLY